MHYAGIDYHKRYSFVSIQDEAGRIVREQRVEHRQPERFRQLLGHLEEPVSVVFESSSGWVWLYEILEEIPNVVQITLANPYRVRLIAEAEIKTDRLDARRLATLQRLGVVPGCYIPDAETRRRKELLRQRAYSPRSARRSGLGEDAHRGQEPYCSSAGAAAGGESATGK